MKFRDENYIYFVLDLILGGELFDLMDTKGNKTNEYIKAWKSSAFYKSFGSEDH